MIRIIGSVEGEVQLDRAIGRLTAGTRDMRVPFEKVGEDFREVEKLQFDAEGYGWEELSPAYEATKQQQYPGKTILRRTDRLYNAMTHKQALDNVSTVKPMEAEFGARGVAGQRGSWHQLGAGSLPQRKVIDLREQDKRMFTKTVHTYMIRLGREAGFEVMG